LFSITRGYASTGWHVLQRFLLAECVEDSHLQVRAPCRTQQKKGGWRRPELRFPVAS
jgi:hypothetical protein